MEARRAEASTRSRSPILLAMKINLQIYKNRMTVCWGEKQKGEQLNNLEINRILDRRSVRNEKREEKKLEELRKTFENLNFLHLEKKKE